MRARRWKCLITSKASNIVKRLRESEQDFTRALGNIYIYIYIYIFEGEKVLKVLALPEVRWPFYIFMNKRSTGF